MNPSDRSDLRSSVSNVSIKGFSFKGVDLSQSESQYFIEPVETGAFHVYETVTMQRTRTNINLYYHLWKSPIAFTASFLCLALRRPPLTVTHIRYLHLHLLQLHSHLKYPACISTIWLPAFRLENKKKTKTAPDSKRSHSNSRLFRKGCTKSRLLWGQIKVEHRLSKA